MANANTPAPLKPEATPEGKPDTLAPKPEGETTPPTPLEQKVAELQTEVDRLTNLLTKQETIASRSQHDKAVAEKKIKDLRDTIEKVKNGEIDISEINLPAEYTPSQEENIKKDIVIGVQDLILGNPDYQTIISQDITLREVLKKNPLVLISEFISTEDAIDQIREMMDKKVASLKKPQPKKEGEGEGPEFEPGPIQPEAEPVVPAPASEHQTPEEKVEQSIKSKLKFT